MVKTLPDLSLSDIDLFLRVTKLRSLRECARQVNLTPGAVSKALQRLEERLGCALVLRSIAGTVVTPEGNIFADIAERLVSVAAEGTLRLSVGNGPTEKVWSIGSISFLSSCLLSRCIPTLVAGRSNMRVRIVEFTHNQLVSHGLNGGFEIAVHIGRLEWTQAWNSYEVGSLRFALYAGVDHPLAKKTEVSQSDVIGGRFVVPMGWTEQGFARGIDYCPLSWGQRVPGHEVVTAETAATVVAMTDQLGFLPTIVARNSCDANLIREIRVREWGDVERSIFVSIRSDLVSTVFLRDILAVVADKLR